MYLIFIIMYIVLNTIQTQKSNLYEHIHKISGIIHTYIISCNQIDLFFMLIFFVIVFIFLIIHYFSFC